MKFTLRKNNPEGYRKFYFPSGEMGIELLPEEEVPLHELMYVKVYAELSDANSIIELLLLTNVLRSAYWDSDRFYLEIPYIPFGRQDRHTTTNNPFSLKVFAEILNNLKYDIVETYDPHSLVTGALINNLVIRDCNSLFYEKIIEIHGSIDNVILIAPDAGAEKRVYSFAKEYGIENVIVCSKKRSGKTGEIISLDIPYTINTYEAGGYNNRDVIVLDDICDGGATFINVAKQIPNYRKSLSLFVTHGIFSKGRKILEDAGYNHVYAAFDFLEKKECL